MKAQLAIAKKVKEIKAKLRSAPEGQKEALRAKLAVVRERLAKAATRTRHVSSVVAQKKADKIEK